MNVIMIIKLFVLGNCMYLVWLIKLLYKWNLNNLLIKTLKEFMYRPNQQSYQENGTI